MLSCMQFGSYLVDMHVCGIPYVFLLMLIPPRYEVTNCFHFLVILMPKMNVKDVLTCWKRR
jgi:hypothetical protein